MIIDRATMTGADDSVSPEDLLNLSKTYPFVEWGILISESRMGSPRYPSHEWLLELAKLVHAHPKQMQLSYHLCGTWVYNLMMAKFDFYDEWHEILRIFDRCQLNFHASKKPTANPKFLSQVLKTYNIPHMLPFNEENHKLMEALRMFDVPIFPLFDNSGGRGVNPESWPKRVLVNNYPISSSGPDQKPLYCGYAGGLGPDNLKQEKERIREVVDSDGYYSNDWRFQIPIWIDMETKIRSEDDKVFDLDKVEECLQIVRPDTYVTYTGSGPFP